MSRIAVNIEVFGDFDIAVTHLVMLAPDGLGKAQVRTMVKEVKLNNRMTDDPEQAIKELKQMGFTPCSTMGLTIGGGL